MHPALRALVREGVHREMVGGEPMYEKKKASSRGRSYLKSNALVAAFDVRESFCTPGTDDDGAPASPVKRSLRSQADNLGKSVRR